MTGRPRAPLVLEGGELVVAAVAAAKTQEAVGQRAAFEEGGELVLHELGNVGRSDGFGLGEEGRRRYSVICSGR